MKRIVLIISIVLIVVGGIGRVYADQYSYVSADGMLHDSIWLPLGTLMIVLGVFILIVLGIVSLIGYLRKRGKA